MTVTRLRPLPDLGAYYPTPHDGTGHRARIDATVDLGRRHIAPDATVADLSTGSAEIPRRIAPDGAHLLGEYAPGYPITGPIETTAVLVTHVDAWVLAETLEHLDDPAMVLRLIRPRADLLLLTTPIGCWDDTNGEHCWAWDRDGVEGLLAAAGWTVVEFASVDGGPYRYGLWVAS